MYDIRHNMKGTHCEVFEIGTLGKSGISEPSGILCPFIDTRLIGRHIMYRMSILYISSILPRILFWKDKYNQKIRINSPNRTSRMHPTTLRVPDILIPEYSSQMVVQLVSLVIPCELHSHSGLIYTQHLYCQTTKSDRK